MCRPGLNETTIDQCNVNVGGSSAIVDVMTRLDPEIDLVVTGHTNWGVNCPDFQGTGIMMTGAASVGRLVTDIDLPVSRAPKEVVSAPIDNVIVRRPEKPKPADITALINKYGEIAAPIENEVIAGMIDRYESLGAPLIEGAVETVRRIAGRLPMDVISDLMGVPEADRAKLRRLADTVVHREDGLLDVPRLAAQLAGLERRVSRGCRGSIDHLPGGHDDLANAAAGADIAVIEGMMGLFDGATPDCDEGSTAEIAKWLDAPVVLVIDASGIARTVAAIAAGFARFDPALKLRGLLCNRIGGRGHLDLLRAAHPEVPIVGGLPDSSELAFPERHRQRWDALPQAHHLTQVVPGDKHDRGGLREQVVVGAVHAEPPAVRDHIGARQLGEDGPDRPPQGLQARPLLGGAHPGQHVEPAAQCLGVSGHLLRRQSPAGCHRQAEQPAPRVEPATVGGGEAVDQVAARRIALGPHHRPGPDRSEHDRRCRDSWRSLVGRNRDQSHLLSGPGRRRRRGRA